MTVAERLNCSPEPSLPLTSGWLVALFNNRGVIKPQHGVMPVDHSEAQRVILRSSSGVTKREEWITGASLIWNAENASPSTTITVPAGSVRYIAIHPANH